jgi:hypothetical protein
MVRRGQPNRERGKALERLPVYSSDAASASAVQPQKQTSGWTSKDLPVRARVFEQHAIDLHDLLADSQA